MSTNDATAVIDEAVKKQPKKKWYQRKRLWFALVLLLFYWDVLRVVPIRISPETTYITKPLTADGKRVDYFKGFEELLYPPQMQTDDNGARMVVRALGTETARQATLETDPVKKAKLEERTRQIYEKLGLDPNEKPTLSYREPFQYLQDLEKKTGKKYESEIEPTSPWTDEDYPELADWLKENTAALDLVANALKKPVYFMPLTRGTEEEPLLETVLIGDFQRPRGFARGLIARARHRIAAGDIDGAMDDTIAIRRLGRFSGHQGFLVGALVGIAIEGMGLSVELFDNPEHSPTKEQIARLKAELEKLPPSCDYAECMKTERYASLDSFQYMSRGFGVNTNFQGEEDSIFARQAGMRTFDFNVMMKRLNKDFDTLIDGTNWKEKWWYDPKQSQARPWMMISRYYRSQEVYKVLFRLLVPAVEAGREAYRRRDCSENLYKIALAMHEYTLDHGTLPPAYTVDANGKPLHSWRTLLLPYLGQEELYKKIKLDEPWDSEYNKQFHATSLPVFQCPSNWRSVDKPGWTAYSVVLGDETLFDATGKGKPLPANRDTILVVETLHARNWMDPTGELTLDDAMKFGTLKVHTDTVGVGSFHAGGMNVAKANGSVEFIANTETLKF